MRIVEDHTGVLTPAASKLLHKISFVQIFSKFASSLQVKRTKQRDGFFNRSYHGENPFQREHDRKRIKVNCLVFAAVFPPSGGRCG